MTACNNIIHRLYQGATQWPLIHFQEAALDTVAEIIPFDSAMWGRGGEPPEAIVDVHLERQPQQMIDNYMADFQQEDFLADAVRSQPGKTVNLVDLMSREAFEKTRIYREFACRWGVQQVLSTCWAEPMTGLIGMLSLWRQSPQHPFSERERIDLEQLIPHLAEAHRICRITYMLRLDQATQKQGQALALCNPRGALIEAEAAFFKLVTREWRHWHGTTLPKELLPFLTQGQEYQGATVAITTQPVGGMLLVRLRALTVLDTLSEKQRLVALRYTQGESHRDIAQTFGLSENTVRNHIATIFKKCAVNNKSELTALIMKHRDA